MAAVRSFEHGKDKRLPIDCQENPPGPVRVFTLFDAPNAEKFLHPPQSL
jgi:hypothetical protein